MASCTNCSAPLPHDERLCSACGYDFSSGGTIQKEDSFRPPSSGGIDHGQFVPGAMFGDRYRIVALLGKGGMGEVYRADDLKLGQPVALKLLSKALAGNEDRRQRLLGEVRVARQVAHPNVCRVYDVGDLGGEQFLTMEYIQGEDLASLLNRIGRLPKDKGIEIARQLCAGVAAAHERGILHRDLKPANIMLDERGRVRITDFGLASLAGATGNAFEGTPAYMAPEQLAGREVTIRSDIYALGLLLYEIFTGRQPFAATTVAGLREQREQKSLTDPSQIVDDLDPAVERVILRCLENDPHDRPQSAMAVAVALPGGDPLAAALAAGETPSPELLAAAGDSAGLKPAIAIPLLLVVLIASIVSLLLKSQSSLTAYVNHELPPEALSLKSREIIRALGYDEKPVDTAFGFHAAGDLFRYVRERDKSPRRWERLRNSSPAPLMFWYREANQPLAWTNFFSGRVTESDPPQMQSGMKLISLDLEGRLVSFSAVPEQVVAKPSARRIEWQPLFSAAAIDLTSLTSAEPQWVPPSFADARAAWVGKWPTGEPLRIEAAAFRGRPVYFELIGLWTRPARMQPVPVTTSEKVSQGIFLTLFGAVILGSVLIARRNLKLGKGDRRGAARIALMIFLLTLAQSLITTSHVATEYEWGILIQVAASAMIFSVFVWLLYLALEPYVRRRWPHALITWGKMLAGKLGDPLVGRDLLIGAAAGAALGLLWSVTPIVTRTLGGSTDAPRSSLLQLGGAEYSLAALLKSPAEGVTVAFVGTFLLLLFRIALRREWVAVAAILTIVVVTSVEPESLLPSLISGLTAWSLLLFVIMRFGLVATAAMVAVSDVLGDSGAVELSGWASHTFWMPLAAIAALAIAAFYKSLAGRPLFRESLLDS